MTRRAVGRTAIRAYRLGALVLACVALSVAAPAVADEPASAGESQYGYALAHELMSPFCPGRTLAACPSDKAAEVRQWILLQEAAGASREEVIATLEARFGEVIRSSPEAEGWGLAAWLLPGAALLVGAVVVWALLRRMTARGGSTAISEPASTASTASGARVTPLRATPSGPAVPGASGGAAVPDEAELERLVDAELAASER